MNAWELYADGKKVAETRDIHHASYRYGEVELAAGKKYALRLDYHEFHQDADMHLVWSPPPVDRVPEAVAAAKQADAVVLVLGLSPRLEGEEMKVQIEGFSGGDRVSLDIPKAQQDLMEAVAAVGKPTVLVLMNGSAVSINWAKEHIPAIVELWYPGQAGGTALADVLFGDYNPAGRLPVTFYKSASQLPAFDNYNMNGKTYRFFEGEALYPFGYGLSYTTFEYSNLKTQGLTVSVDVTNTGKRAGEEVVELYVKGQGAGSPIRSLQGFQRIALKAGEKKTVTFKPAPEQLGSGTGPVEFSVGGKQPDATGKGFLTGQLLR